MKIPKEKFREVVFQILYSCEFEQSDNLSCLKDFISRELVVSKRAVEEALVRVAAILEKRERLDELIARTSASYQLSRIHSVERNILRLGLYELLFDDLIPPKVAIAEALRLAKKFASPDSMSFINAILDQIYKAKEGN